MQSEMEQMYLLEIVVEDVDVIEEGILDTLRDQVAIADQQMKQRNTVGKDAPAKDNNQTNDGAATVENKEAADPNSNPNTNATSENAQPSRPEIAPYSRQKIERNAPVKVIAQFLDFPALKIKMNEFEKYIEQTPSPSTEDKRNLQQGGKSCLFSMLPKDMIDAIRKHPVVIQVHRESSKDEPAHLIGIGRICLGQEFIDTVALGNTPTIAVTTVQGDYDVANIFGDVTATVSLVIRLSCVGPSITTQFTYNQFDGNFKFSSSESIPKNDAAKSKPEYKGQKEAFFHKDDVLGLFDGPPPECKLPASTIPWKKLHEEPVDSRSCGSQRLFKEQARRYYVDDTFDCTPSFRGCCGGPSRMCDDFVPPEFGRGLPPEIKKMLPTASDYEAPSGGQFTGVNVNWRNPPIQAESNPTNMRVCCAMTDGRSGAGQTSGCPCMSRTQPVYVCSNPKVNLAPPLEDAGPHLKCSPYPGTSSFKRDLQYVPCPNAPDALNPGNVSCGLEELLNQQNLKNLLQPSLMAPVCPPDSSGRRPSLCTCPKVPTVVSKPIPGGVVRCECTNILTAMKPIELPYTCPKEPEQLVNEVPTCPPCPPVPIRLPPPAPECPLSKLLKESQAENMPQQDKPAPIQGIPPQRTTLPPKSSDDSRARVADTSKPTVPSSDTTPKSGDPMLDQSSEMTFSKSKKAHKVQQDEDTRPTTTSTYSSEPQLGQAHSRPSKHSKTGSTVSSIVSIPPKKKKKRQIVDEGRGSGYTPTRMMEPPKELNIAYTPTAGLYPANTIGHRDCIPIIPLVPKRMGWLWNIKDAEGFLKPGRGWRPGSIQGNVMKVMDTVKTGGKTTSPPIKVKPIICKAKSVDQHTRKVESTRQMTSRASDAPLVAPCETSPTLHVHKKHGLHYVSMIPPPKDPAQKRPKIKRMNSRGDMVDESDSDDSHPAQFRIDTKHRDALFGNSDLYETDDTSTVSEDSYQMEVVVPSTLRHRQPQPVKIDMEVQVSENDFINKVAAESKVHEDEPSEQKKSSKRGKKKNSAASKKGKKGRSSSKAKK